MATSTVFELRQYTLHPGRRDDLIELFEREFLDAQEAVGMWVPGQFRDLDDPDRFVWVRGFPDMRTRRTALQAFYGGPVWAAHRNAANATMVDSDDVLLLRAAGTEPPFTAVDRQARSGRAGAGGSLVSATVYPLPLDDDELPERIGPRLRAALPVPIVTLRTEPAENTFPALPVRTGENVFVWLAAFPTAAEHRQAFERLEADEGWRTLFREELADRLVGKPQRLRLAPTARSRYR